MPSGYDQLADALQAVYRSLIEAIRRQNRESDLPFMVAMVLGYICKEPGVTVSALARCLGIAKSHASAVVEGLSQRGLVIKQADPRDKRLLRLFPADAGIALINQGQTATRRRFLELTSDLPEEQARRLASDLEALQAVISRPRAHATESSCNPEA